MTTGDFILGIITSLIASILYGLRRRGYTLLKQLLAGTYKTLLSNHLLPVTLFVVTLFTLVIPPNKVLAPTDNRWRPYLDSVDKVERLTGYDFFRREITSAKSSNWEVIIIMPLDNSESPKAAPKPYWVPFQLDGSWNSSQ